MDRAAALSFTVPVVNYQDSIAWLYGTQQFGIKLGLENMYRLLWTVGVDPESPGPQIFHVAGTNGKGSVCAVAERILRDGGVKTGLFTSPHLVSYRERIRVSGIAIPEEAVASGLSHLRELVSDWENHPTFFELSLALAMRYFLDQGCEVVILETGMGGRLDATNALRSNVSAITSISLDHQQWLGDTVRKVAVEKAGILKHDTTVIIGDLCPDARDVIGRRALMLKIPCIEAHGLPDDWTTGLKGPHQSENAAIAVEAACRLEGDRLTEEGIRQSVAQTTWPGRFQVLDDGMVLDGAHNPGAAQVLREAWKAEYGDEKAHLVFGAVTGKDVVGILRELLPVIDSVDLVPVHSARALPLEEMRQFLAEAGGANLLASESESLQAALTKARERSTASGGRVLVAGSLFLVGEVLSHVTGGTFEPSLQ